MKALIVQHVLQERPGLFEDCLARDGWEVDLRIMEKGEPLPDTMGDYQFFLLLGGPMSANESEKHPYLLKVQQLINSSVRDGIPFIGICLGAQLLARALGADVYSGERPEFGWDTVELTEAGQRDPVFAGLPTTLDVFQWHGDTCDLPPGAELIASNRSYPHQAFSVGRKAYGLQFHLEVTEEMAISWLEEGAEDVKRALGAKAFEEMVNRTPEMAQKYLDNGWRFWKNFSSLF